MDRDRPHGDTTGLLEVKHHGGTQGRRDRERRNCPTGDTERRDDRER